MIRSEKKYIATVQKIEELLSFPENIENREANGNIRLNQLSDLVQEMHHQISPHTLSEAIKFRIQERGLSLVYVSRQDAGA